MKRNLSLVLFLLLIFNSCGIVTPQGEYDMELTIGVSTPQILDALSGYSEDPFFRMAMQEALRKYPNSDRDFVSLFGKAFAEIDPTIKLSAYFESSDLREKISHTSTNNGVLRVLREEVDDAVDRSFNILLTRLDRHGILPKNLDIIRDGNILHLTFRRLVDPERVKRLCTTRGRLEFWETYNLPDIIDNFLEAEELIKHQNPQEELPLREGDNKNIAEKPDDQSDETMALLEQLEEEVSDIKYLSDEEILKEYPLRSLLQLAVDSDGNIQNSATVGYALIQDTSKINTMLKSALEVFPVNLILAWTNRPRQAESDILELVAIKVTTHDRRELLDGHVITNARQDYDMNGNVQVTIEMNTDGANMWRRITRTNIGKQLAIMLDGYVYSYPMVNGEIPNGKSSISGIGTVAEAQDLANVLITGMQACNLEILSEEITKREP